MEFIAPENMRIEYYVGRKGEIPFHGIRYAKRGYLEKFPSKAHIVDITPFKVTDIDNVLIETQFAFQQDKNVNRVSQSKGLEQAFPTESLLESFSYYLNEDIMDANEAKSLCGKIAAHAKSKTQQQTADAMEMTLAKFKTVMFNAFTVAQTVLPLFVPGTRGMSGPREYAQEKKDGTIVVPVDVVKVAKLGERVKFSAEKSDDGEVLIIGRRYAKVQQAS